MPDFVSSPTFLAAVVTFATVVLATVALGLLWEGTRRWLRARAATEALTRVKEGGLRPGSVSAGDRWPGSVLLVERAFNGPAWLEAILLRLPHREDLQRLLDQAGVRAFSVLSLLLTCAGIGVAFALVAGIFAGNPLLALLAGAVGAYIPIMVVKVKRGRRFAEFEAGFPEAIDLLARAARAGHSLSAGLQVVAEEGEEPVASEFRQVFEEQRFGLPIQDALMGLADRLDLVDVRIFVTSVLIQRESGGNLAENLDGLSAVIRGRFRFRRDVKTKTAHGRISGFVVAVAPVVAGTAMYLVNPVYMSPLFTEALGRRMLLGGAIMMLAGFLVIRRLVDIKY
jgi:tight adherence protein B